MNKIISCRLFGAFRLFLCSASCSSQSDRSGWRYSPIRTRQSEALIALLGLRRVEDRVRGFLELLAEEYGQPCEDGLRLNLRLTHQLSLIHI